MKRYVFLLSFLLSSYSFLATQTGNPDQIVGVWKSSNNGIMIKIDKVGDHFQGRIVWLEENAGNQPLLDEKNPDERLRKMPLKGNKVIQELTFNPSEVIWEGGTFYNYKEGRLYNCNISLQRSDQIKITRFTQNQQDGVTETWTRQ